MNLWLRLLSYLATCLFKGRNDDPHAVSRWRFTVWLTDLDINGHVNNGRFLELMDLGRFDYFWRSQLRGSLFALKSVPILGGVVIRYRLPLKLMQRVTIQTRLLGFEDKWMIVEQRFVFDEGEKKGVVAAIALTKNGFYERKTGALLAPENVFSQYGLPLPQADLPEAVHTWRAADLGLKDAALEPAA